MGPSTQEMSNIWILVDTNFSSMVYGDHVNVGKQSALEARRKRFD